MPGFRCVRPAVILALSAALAACSKAPTTAAPADLAASDGASAQPPPLITELLAKNSSGLVDEDGAYSDWIEIHNPGDAPYDLGGHHLTDSKKNPRRWTIPEGTVLPPGGYLVVFASGKNRATAGRPLHTSFSLSSSDVQAGCARSGGEYLALTNRDGEPLPPVWSPYPAQEADVSYGTLAPTPDSAAAYFATPSPGAANPPRAALPERVRIEPPSRTFNAGATLPITLAVGSKTATIRYTTNRARPIGAPGMLGSFSADAASDTLTMKAHGLAAGDLVRVSGPAPLLPTVNYFVLLESADTFKLAMEPGGPAIDLTASGTSELRRDAAAGVAATTDLITTTAAHTFFSGDAVQVSASGALPAGLSSSATYYVVPSGATSLRLSPSPTLSPIVDITSAGPVTILRAPSPVYEGPIPITVNTRVRARAFEPDRPDGPISSATYLALDDAAQQLSSNLPLVVSHTWNTAMPNDTTVDGVLMIFEPRPPDNLARLSDPPDLASPCSLERRGSSTANELKFSMSVELQDENGIDQGCRPFGMPAHADWILHAPYRYDRSMIHNDLLYRLSNDAGRYAVRTRLVEHIHNEQSLPNTLEGAISAPDYFGVYSFMEKITRGGDRVDIENLTTADNELPALQGGYLFKVDRLDPGDSGIKPLAGQSFGNIGGNVLAWVTPRESSPDPFKRVTPAQSDWFRAHLGEAWSVLSGPDFADPVNGYARYWDVGSVIDHHILNLVTKSADAYRLSAYWHKPRSGKLSAGPVWDFDRAQGSTDGRDFDYGTWPQSNGTSFFNPPWYVDMFRDPNFWQDWIDRLHQLRQGPLRTANVHRYIDELTEQLNPGDGDMTPAKRSITRWPVSSPRLAANNTPITNGLFDGQYRGEIAWLKYWWEQRLAFMDSQVTRPAALSVPGGAVAAGTTVSLSSPSEATPGVMIYYTTTGADPRSRTPGVMLSPDALPYQGPITLTAPTRLFVRVWSPTPSAPIGSGWSAPTIASYTIAAAR